MVPKWNGLFAALQTQLVSCCFLGDIIPPTAQDPAAPSWLSPNIGAQKKQGCETSAFECFIVRFFCSRPNVEKRLTFGALQNCVIKSPVVAQS
jgi:hypothetical protein